MDFKSWLKRMSRLSENSIYKYSHAVVTVSEMMLSEGIIKKSLTDMDLYELDFAIKDIFNTPSFILKNETGNRMYGISLKWYRNYKSSFEFDNMAVQKEIVKIENSRTIAQTEKDAIVKARVGQGIFRENLIKKYKCCIVTGIDIPQLLIASHIKPWSVCTNNERLCVENGLLLSATYDRLFDCGLITFDSGGKLSISSAIDGSNRIKLKLSNGSKFDIKMVPDMKSFLEYHNDIIFVQ